jgi:NDP-sugar pyrophosphorylase family protein
LRGVWSRVEVVFSRESPEPLETGGGLLLAAPHFEAEAPFFLHNGDILTDLDLTALYEAHTAGEGPGGDVADADSAAADAGPPPPIATLAVARRETSRPLLVDDEGVYGRANRTEGWELIARHPGAGAAEVGFTGIHVLSPAIFDGLEQRGAFSIVESYMRLISAGERVGTFDVTDATWMDMGTPERLERAQRLFGEGG